MHGGVCRLVECELTRNTTGPVGGGGAGVVHAGGVLTLVNTLVYGNIAAAGAGLYAVNASLELSGCSVVGNRCTVSNGGGVYGYDSSVTITNSSIVAHISAAPPEFGGAGLYFQAVSGVPCTLNLHNSTIWNNTATSQSTPEKAQIDFNTPFISNVSYSTVEGWTGSLGGTNNNGLNPNFLRLPSPGPNGQWGDSDDDYGDLRLGPGSPAIDSGDSLAVPSDTFDIDSDGNTTEALPLDLAGNPRFIDDPAAPNTGVGTPPIDRGAYESQVNCLTCPGPREWRSTIGGGWDFPSNWTPSVPNSTHDTLFNLSSIYGVTFPAAQTLAANSATFSKGSVGFNLFGSTLSLQAISTTSFQVGTLFSNSAALSILNGTVNTVDARIGAEIGSTGSLTVGAGGLFNSTRSLTVGFQGTGSLTITGGGRVFSRDATVGDQATSRGDALITGTGSRWDIPFFLIIDNGEVVVRDGGEVNTGFGTYLFNQGRITGNGTIGGPVVNFGSIEPGNSPGTLTINGSYQQVGQIVGLGEDSGKLNVQVAGTGANQFDRLVVNGSATLGGGLVMSFMNGYQPGATDNVQVVSATQGLIKPFDVIFFPALAPQGAQQRYLRAQYSGLRGPGGSVNVNVGNLSLSPTFSNPESLALDGLPSNAAIGDVNGDNRPDLVVTIPDGANPTGTTGVLVVLINQGGSGPGWAGFAQFGAPVPVGLNPKGCAIANIDNAPGNEIVVANSSGNNLSVLKLVTGSFQTIGTQATGVEPVSIAAADFDRDNDIDLVIANGGGTSDTGSVSMLRNNSTPTSVSFAPRLVPMPARQKPTSTVPFNPDQDKDLDVAVAFTDTGETLGGVTLFLNGIDAGAIPELLLTAGATSSVPVGAKPVQVVAGRLLPDSPATPSTERQDLIAVNRNGSSVSVLVNTTTALDAPTFAPAVEYAFDAGTTGSSPRGATVVDLDGDMDLDAVVVANNPAGTGRLLKVLRNDSSNQSGIQPAQVAFSQLADVASGAGPFAVLNADVDADGRPDLVTVNSTNLRNTPNSVQIVRNGLPSPALTAGACCFGSSCVVVQALQCSSSGQTFLGAATTCNAAGVFNAPCCKADFNRVGGVTIQDIFDYLNAWFATQPTTDINASGSVTIQDLFDFLNAWFLGC